MDTRNSRNGMSSQTNKQTNKQTDIQTHKQTNRQTDKQNKQIRREFSKSTLTKEINWLQRLRY